MGAAGVGGTGQVGRKEGSEGRTGDRVQYRDNALERGTHEAEAPWQCPVWSVVCRPTGTITIDLSNGGMRHL